MHRDEVRSPIRWMGGKETLSKRIVAELPECDVYVEPFGGAASILFARPMQRNVLEVYNDLHEGAVTFFRALRENGEELHRRLELTLFSDLEYRLARDWRIEKDPIEKARKFYVTIRQGYNGGTDASGWARAFSVKNVHGWANSIERLPQCIERFRNVQVECADWRDVCERYDGTETLFYMDPPYVMDTRVDKSIYEHEFTDSQHDALIKFMLDSISMIALSGYESEKYRVLEENGWKRIDWFLLCTACTTNGGERRKTWRVESLWLNPLLQLSRRLEGSLACSEE